MPALVIELENGRRGDNDEGDTTTSQLAAGSVAAAERTGMMCQILKKIFWRYIQNRMNQKINMTAKPCSTG
jgi:hypothetical protein